MRSLRARKGSNQYQTRGTAAGSPPRAQAAEDVTAALDDLDDIAWAFHPDRALWTEGGFTRESAARWLEAGLSYAEADAYTGWMLPDDARRWIDAGCAHGATAVEFSNAGFAPEEAGGWVRHGIPASNAETWRDAGFTADECHSWWVVNQFPLDEAVPWRAVGFTPPDAGAWRAKARAQEYRIPKGEQHWWAVRQVRAGTRL